MRPINSCRKIDLWFRRLVSSGLTMFAFSLGASAQNPVIDWNAIAITTALSGNQTLSPGSATAGGTGLYLAYVHLAIYNAVNAVDRRYQLYGPEILAQPGASADAAAITAAYETLASYFPDQQPSLSSQYATSLAAIPGGPGKSNGIAAGHAAAAALVALRANDGRGAAVPYSYPSVPTAGVWIPTPPAFLAPQTPWVGQMVPFTMTNPGQFLPHNPPPDLGSEEWARDYNETKTLGSASSTVRTAEQTEIGLFWTEHTGRQYGRAFRSLAAERALDTSQTARLFAMLWTGYADSFIGCMNAKYHFSFWRPVTAIRNGDLDNNPATAADSAWSPLATTPNHPEFPAAHGCVTGAVARTLEAFFHSPNVKLTVTSTGTNTTHTFNNVRELEREVFGARIYAGFHYHHSLVEGFELGHRVAGQMTRKFFRPVNEDDEDGED